MKVAIALTAAFGLLAGCSRSHPDPSGHDHATDEPREATRVIDPVCGKSFDKFFAKVRDQYKGNRYFFCSESCKAKFKESPDQYAK